MIGLLVTGYDPGLALSALWRGAFGSADSILSATLPRSIPLIIIGLAVGFAFRAGALNIGAEGQFLAGATGATFAAGLLAGSNGWIGIPLVLGIASVSGLLWVLRPTILRVRFGVIEVISTLLLNFVAEALVSWMVTGPLQEARGVYPQSDLVDPGLRLPVIPGTRLHLGLLLALLLSAACWIVAKKTLVGFQLRAVGANPVAAEAVGRVRAGRMVALSLGVSGMLAGLAGGIELTGSSYALFQNLSPGYGFTAIAVALLARLHPGATVATGVLFGALSAGAAAMQREAGVPAVVGSVVEATVILVLLVAESFRQRASVSPSVARGTGFPTAEPPRREGAKGQESIPEPGAHP
jgi:simple sugar transport system permease protein